ncbi:MAG: Hpt domain-containing protein [Sphingomicrobium sp.]
MFASVKRLIPLERLHGYLRDLDREYLMLFDSAATGTSLQSQAHKIVSQAGMLGLTRMSECARTLENACRSGAGPAAALLECRAASEDVRLYAMPAADAPAD